MSEVAAEALGSENGSEEMGPLCWLDLLEAVLKPVEIEGSDERRSNCGGSW